jgi:hypothetical protein
MKTKSAPKKMNRLAKISLITAILPVLLIPVIIFPAMSYIIWGGNAFVIYIYYLAYILSLTAIGSGVATLIQIEGNADTGKNQAILGITLGGLVSPLLFWFYMYCRFYYF